MNKLKPKRITALHIQEKQAKKEIRKNCRKEFLFGNQIYRAGVDLFKILPVGWKPPNNCSLVVMILALRAIAYLRASQILLSNGYILEAASLGANLMEIVAMARKVKVDGKAAADKWLNHDNQYPCWTITGKKGELFKEEYFSKGAAKLEKCYKDLCAYKHSSGKTKMFNYGTVNGVSSLFNAPYVDFKVIRAFSRIQQAPVFYILIDSKEILTDVIDKDNFNRWCQKFNVLCQKAIKYYQLANPLTC